MNNIGKRILVLMMVFVFHKLLIGQESLMDKSINLKSNKNSFENLVTIIKKQTGLKVAFSRSQIDVKQVIIVNSERLKLKELLNHFRKYNIDYKLIGNIISLYPSKKKKKRSKKVVVSGYIEDKLTGERLIGASIYFPESYTGTSSNEYGFFSIPVKPENKSLVCSYIGYKKCEIPLDFISDTLIKVELESANELDEIVVKSTTNEMIDKRIPIGIVRLPMAKIKSTPTILGETDALKVAQLLPGISEGSEGNSGLYIRGGSSDQNLILLDGITVYNPNHLFGFFSVFNGDAIKDFKIIKGGFPARYGGRLSSVVDLRMREGNMKKITGSVSLGLISSKLHLEGPIIKDKTSFFVSARRTYIDLLAGKLLKKYSSFDKSNYYFYDVNAKINHKFSDKHRLYFSYYTGRDNGDSEDTNSKNEDKLKTEEISKLSWGNSIYGLRWNWLMSSNTFLNTTVSYSTYDYLNDEVFKNRNKIDDDWISKEYSSNIESGINIFSAGLNFNWIPSTRHHIRFGAKYFYHTFNTGMESKKFLSANSQKQKAKEKDMTYANEANVFVEDDIQLSSKLKANLGLHFSMYKVKNKFYRSLEPRFSLKYDLSEEFQLNAGGAVMKQYTQLLSFSRITLASDIWVPVTEKIVPAKSKQISTGFRWMINDKWSFSTEGYYKDMRNVIGYSAGASFFDRNSWQERVEQGSGKSYGLEFLMERKKGRLTGWIAYTLAESTRKFDKINSGNSFPYKYDKRHDFNIVLDYKLTKSWSVNAIWTYKTGNAETLGVIKYPAATTFSGGQHTNFDDIIYQKRNNYRMPPYHRLDISVNWKKKSRKLTHQISFGVYNAYNRKNAYKISLYDKSLEKENGRGYVDTKEAKEKSLFGVLPSFTYTLKF